LHGAGGLKEPRRILLGAPCCSTGPNVAGSGSEITQRRAAQIIRKYAGSRGLRGILGRGNLLERRPTQSKGEI